MTTKYWKTLLFGLTSAFLSGCGSTTQLSSSWNSSVTIDGSSDEWPSHLVPMKDTPIQVGVQNDGEYVYVCVVSPDRQFRRMAMGLGLTVWLESEQGRKIGIRYPTGMRGPGFMQQRDRLEEEDNDREDFVERALQDFEILGPGKKDRNLLSTLQSTAVKVKIGGSTGPMVYELRVPLKESSDNPYALNAEVGSTIRVNIETGKMEPGMRPGGMGEGMQGGRPPEGGGGPRGGGFGRPGGGRGGDFSRANRPEPLEVSFEVRLSNSKQ